VDITIAIIGWVGTVLLLAAYALLTARRVRASDASYQLMNLVGGLALLANTAYNLAWPSAALNLAWFGIGVTGLVRSRRPRGATTPEAR
jgi:hypothetical protein